MPLFPNHLAIMKPLAPPLTCVWLCAAGFFLLGAQAVAQETQKESTNVLGDIGRWFDKSMTSIGDQFKNAVAQALYNAIVRFRGYLEETSAP